jgi:hypothetical protein
MQDVWQAAKPEWLVWVATQKGVLTERELRLFGCFCARQKWDKLTDERSRKAIEISELYAYGEATDEAMDVAAEAAAWAAREATRSAAWAAAWPAWAAWAVVDRSVAAARAAAWAAREATRSAAYVAARTDQANYLRSNCVPNFEE